MELDLHAIDADSASWTWVLSADGRELCRDRIVVDHASAAAALLSDLPRVVALRRDPRDPNSESAELGALRRAVADSLLGRVRSEVNAATGVLRVRAIHSPASGVPIELGVEPRCELAVIHDAPGGPRLASEPRRLDRALALFPGPTDHLPLRQRAEREALTRVLQGSADIRSLLYGVDRAAVTDAVSEGADVLHVAAHGSRAGIQLEGADGAAELLTGEDLADLVKRSERVPALIVLACCESAAVAGARADEREQPVHPVDRAVRLATGATSASQTFDPARTLAERVGVPVVGMRYPVSDAFASAFAANLFEALLRGAASLASAVNNARLAALRSTRATSVLDAGAVVLISPAATDPRWDAPRPAAPKRRAVRAVVGALEGRSREISEALAALRAGRSVCLWGPPGAGISACAAEISDAWHSERRGLGSQPMVTRADSPPALRHDSRGIFVGPLAETHARLLVWERRATAGNSQGYPEDVIDQGRGLPAALTALLRDDAAGSARVVACYEQWIDLRLSGLSMEDRLVLEVLAGLEAEDREQEVVTAVGGDLSASVLAGAFGGLVAGAGTPDDPWRLDRRVVSFLRSAPACHAPHEIERRAAEHWLMTARPDDGAAYQQAALRALPYLCRLGEWQEVVAICGRVLNKSKTARLARQLRPALDQLVALSTGAVWRRDAERVDAVACDLLEAGDIESDLRLEIRVAESEGRWVDASRHSTQLVRRLTKAGYWREALLANARRAEQVRRAGLGPLTRLAVEGERLEVLSHTPSGADEVLVRVPKFLEELELAAGAGAPEGHVDAGEMRQSAMGLGWQAAFTLRRWDVALEYNSRRLDAKREIGATDSELRLTRFDSLEIMLQLEQYDDAMALLSELKQGFEHDGDSAMVGQCFSVSAEIHRGLGLLADAARLQERALEYAYLPPPRANVCGVAHHNLADLLRQHDRSDPSIVAHQVAAALLLHLIDDAGAPVALAELASTREASRDLLRRCDVPVAELVASFDSDQVAAAWEAVRRAARDPA